jgi:hypothetical protein
MASQSKTPFDFEHAEVGQPGPDGTPITAKYINRLGIPTIETRPKPGFRSFTVPLSYLYRRPLVRITSPPNKEPKPPPKSRPAKVAQMLALAHDIQGKLDRGEYKDQAAAAKVCGLSSARVSQLLDLALLAPDIQEEVLFLEAVDGVEPNSERELRRALSSPVWAEQRAVRRRLRPGPEDPLS